MEVMYMKKLTFNKKRAFTLVELLIVIAIIGILFIVLISKVDFATDKSKATGVQTDFRSFQVAFETVARENSGFNTLGYDIGDKKRSDFSIAIRGYTYTNEAKDRGDGVKNSYDKGDKNLNGICDEGEVFTGKKIYTEVWKGVYSLVKPGSVGYDRDVLDKLESAINANLDPKLHITLGDDGKITMSNGAQDPWNTEYHGYYITNATVDGKDKGSIVMYSNGANQEFGSEHAIANGVVSINIPGNNIYGKDDYGMAVIYTYKNGFGEIKTMTSGFSPDLQLDGGSSMNGVLNGDMSPDTEQQVHNGGLYMTDFVFDMTNGPYWNTQLEYGSPIPAQPKIGDMYLYEDYMYIYGCIMIGDMAIPIDMVDQLMGESGLENTDMLNDALFTAIDMMHLKNNEWYPIVNPAYRDKSYFSDMLPKIGNESITTLVGTFSDCINMNSMPNLPDSLKVIGPLTFQGTHMGEMEIPEGIEVLGNLSFMQTEASEICIPASVIRIDHFAFMASQLQNLTFAENSQLKSIGVMSFGACIDLNNVELPEGLESIGSGAFSGCTSLTTVHIPSSVTSIGKVGDARRLIQELLNLFDEFENEDTMVEQLKFFLDNSMNPYYGCMNVTEMLVHPDNTYYYGDTAIIETATKTLISGMQNTVIPNDVQSIGAYSFSTQVYLKSIVIPEGVTHILDYAFADCAALEDVTIPSTLNTIKMGAFSNCMVLPEIELPEIMKEIGTEAFMRCTALEYVKLPLSLTMLSDGVFQECVSLSHITLPTNLQVIGSSVFDGCSSLEAMLIPASVNTMGNYVFSDCPQLKEVRMETGSRLTSMGTSCFRNSGIESFEFPIGIKEVPDYTFYDCNSLSVFDLPVHIETIGEHAYDITGITSITVPVGSKLTLIKYGAFWNNHSLLSIDLSNATGGLVIGSQAFHNNQQCLTAYLPDNIVSVGAGAFFQCGTAAMYDFTYNASFVGSKTNPYLVSTMFSQSYNGYSNLPEGCELISWDKDVYWVSDGDDDVAGKSVYIPSTVRWILPESMNRLSNGVTISPDNPYFKDAGNCIYEVATKSVIRLYDNCTIPADIESISKYAIEHVTINNITFLGTMEEWENIDKPSSLNAINVTCTDGSAHIHNGGRATCQSLAVCSTCGVNYGDYGLCSGGMATCQELAICSTCGNEYGEKGAHTGGTATCKNRAQCTLCGKYYGTLTRCQGGQATCMSYAVCDICHQTYGELGYCEGGKATCIKKAVCSTCGEPYGSLASCAGGFATCVQRAICSTCGQEYGNLGTHNLVNNICTYCGVEAVVIETAHNPYSNNYNYIVMGTWNFAGAKSVNITITYQTESTSYDWVSICSGTSYVSGSSHSSSRTYLNTSGQVVAATGIHSSVKFGGKSKTTKTFNNINMTNGTVIFRTDGSENNYYGATITITPNY